tara:strand:+ start:39 stop:482 length:444 start_codon:yes stop_codon:yes gene_type:complete
MGDREIAIEVLEDFLKIQHSSSSEQTVVESEINDVKEELLNLDDHNAHDLDLKKRTITKIRDLEEKIEQRFFKSRPFPSDLYTKDLKTKINYLNSTFEDNCPVCKNGILRLVPSGKVWMCTNRCNGKRWCTTDEIELLGVDIKRGNT